MQPKVSIVIPMYNEERFIWRCLESLKTQSFNNFELVLIDDWSKDKTLEIAKSYDNDFDLKILSQANWWPGKARNLWANNSKWDILIFVDADMKFDNKFIEELISPIIKWEEIWTAHWVELIGNPENPLARAWCINRIPNPWLRWWVYRAILKDIFLTSWGFDSSKWYFDDDLSKINNWLWALTVMSAICYHNNPESISEIFKHSQWVWKSLIQTWYIKNYLRIYKNLLFIFLLLCLLIWWYLIYKWLLIYSFLVFILLILAFTIYKAFQRTIKEKYLSHLFFIPIVIITRWFWYLIWFFKY